MRFLSGVTTTKWESTDPRGRPRPRLRLELELRCPTLRVRSDGAQEGRGRALDLRRVENYFRRSARGTWSKQIMQIRQGAQRERPFVAFCDEWRAQQCSCITQQKRKCRWCDGALRMVSILR